MTDDEDELVVTGELLDCADEDELDGGRIEDDEDVDTDTAAELDVLCTLVDDAELTDADEAEG